MSGKTQVIAVDIPGNRVEIESGGYVFTFAFTKRRHLDLVVFTGETDESRIPREYVEEAERRAYAIFASRRAAKRT